MHTCIHSPLGTSTDTFIPRQRQRHSRMEAAGFILYFRLCLVCVSGGKKQWYTTPCTSMCCVCVWQVDSEDLLCLCSLRLRLRHAGVLSSSRVTLQVSTGLLLCSSQQQESHYTIRCVCVCTQFCLLHFWYMTHQKRRGGLCLNLARGLIWIEETWVEALLKKWGILLVYLVLQTIKILEILLTWSIFEMYDGELSE